VFKLKDFTDVWVSPNAPIQLASALAAYESATSKAPATFTSYDEFEAARAALLRLGEAFAQIVKENAANPAASRGIALIKTHTRELTATKQSLDSEYAKRVGQAEAELQYVEGAILKAYGALGDHYERMLALFKSAAEAKKEIEKGDAAGLAEGLAQMAASSKAVEGAIGPLMTALRQDARVSAVRLRGADGICKDFAVGGKEFDRLADFKKNMALFKEAEERAKKTESLATLTKQYLKACVLLTAKDKTDAEKTEAIMAKLAKKVDQAIEKGRGDIAKNQTSTVDNFDLDAANAGTRKNLVDLESILRDKLRLVPNRVTEVRILIDELGGLAPGSAKAELKAQKDKLAAFEKEVDAWVKKHKKAADAIPDLV
jgi:hypothetical protein